MLEKDKIALRDASPYNAAITREQFLFYEVRTTAKLVCEGLNNDEVVVPRYTTGDLTYLYRSGRVSRTGMVIAHALNIHPILNLDLEGHLIVQEKMRGKKATVKRIHEIIRELVVDPQDIAALFAMTPYAYRTGAAERERLAALQTLTTETAFEVLVYRLG